MSFEGFLHRIGKSIKAKRLALGWSQVDAAREIGIPYRRYQSIEAGKANLTLQTLHRIAKSFRADPRDFFA